MTSTLAAALAQRAAEVPDRVFARLSGESFTFGETHQHALLVANGLRNLGVQPGDRVAVFAPNTPDTLFAWLGCAMLGAVEVPINVDARGSFLQYILDDAEPVAIVGDDERLARLAALDRRFDGHVLRIGPTDGGAIDALGTPVPFQDIVASATPDVLAGPGEGDLATIMYTSGTTGPSKGVMLPHGYFPYWGDVFIEPADFKPDDVWYCAQPLFHIDPRLSFAAALMNGAGWALGTRFSASRFWDELREVGATRFQYIGTMLWLLYKQEPSDRDAAQPASVALGAASPPEIIEAFERRFDVRLVEAYGMTEFANLTCQPLDDRRVETIGVAARDVDVRIVDEHDHELPDGQVGEAVARPLRPFISMLGYWRKPEATVETWRNLWYHTGDLLRRDSDGHFSYHGRLKDSIRRRGENVSCWEVEQAFMRHEEVLEAAAFGVPSPLGEQDVAVLIVARPGAEPEPHELHAFVARDLPRFAVPRYIEFVDELPKTPSERIQKAVVEARGLGPDAWDAEAVGVD